MRYWMVIVAISLLAGCRLAQSEFQSKYRPPIQKASTHTSCPVIETTMTAARHDVFIEDLVRSGLENSPRLKAATHRAQALSRRVTQELSLPDPTVNTTTHLAPVETAAGRQAFALGVSQKFVSRQRRVTQAAIATEEYQSAQAELVRMQHELAEQIRTAGYQLLTIVETIKLLQQDLASLAEIEVVILRQFEVDANTSQQDVLNVQIEQSSVENQLTELRQKQDSYSARLVRLVHLPPGTKIKLLDTLDGASGEYDVDQMLSLALAARPELEQQLSRIRRDERKRCLAQLQNRPDYTVGLNWIATSSEGISPVANGDDALQLGVGFNLPIHQRRIQAAICEADEAGLASAAELESLQDQIAEEVVDTLAKLDSATSTLTLLQEDILPKSTRALGLSIDEYTNGKTDYTRLISNWRSLLRHRVAVANLKSQQRQLLATLGRQVGLLEPVEETVNSISYEIQGSESLGSESEGSSRSKHGN